MPLSINAAYADNDEHGRIILVDLAEGCVHSVITLTEMAALELGDKIDEAVTQLVKER
jgi:hypothetical protein